MHPLPRHPYDTLGPPKASRDDDDDEDEDEADDDDDDDDDSPSFFVGIRNPVLIRLREK